jgi:hypothetical protein
MRPNSLTQDLSMGFDIWWSSESFGDSLRGCLPDLVFGVLASLGDLWLEVLFGVAFDAWFFSCSKEIESEEEDFDEESSDEESLEDKESSVLLIIADNNAWATESGSKLSRLTNAQTKDTCTGMMFLKWKSSVRPLEGMSFSVFLDWIESKISSILGTRCLMADIEDSLILIAVAFPWRPSNATNFCSDLNQELPVTPGWIMNHRDALAVCLYAKKTNAWVFRNGVEDRHWR